MDMDTIPLAHPSSGLRKKMLLWCPGGLLHSEEEETIEDFHESMKIPYSASRVKC
jgi:hypothetical protein